ncbi:hypothetical protein LSTR_LSTR006523 [Laodelphax striatellus]|uniref:Glycosyl hydrolase family 13 catalytic domain-containing protein n=1 Tax=Laodelphax striatellus TaxID=195883 RepID=A0A482WXS2_LAOST|nr:hypothetical protein LSTR_LSTR006523 [Laodelphax striatellus]
MTELAGLNVTNNVDPLYSPEARSPEFLLVDEESASTYPLLTPSPPHFDHPLAVLDSNKVLAAYERQLSPSSIDPDLCNAFPPLTAPLGAADFSDVTGSNSANDKGEIKSWHQILNSFSKIDAEKIMICSLKVVAAVENDGPLDVNVRLATVLTRFSLIDVYVEKADAVGDLVRYVQKGVVRSDPGFPWAMWTTGDVDLPRLASRLYLKNETLAVLAVQMMLPGTPSLFYGDEIGLDNIDDHDGERSDLSHAHSLAPMKWQSQNEAKQQFAKPLVLGWMPEAQTRAPRASTRVLSTMAALREGSPSIYMQANWKDKQLLTNCFIRYSEDNFILLERRYPRRFTYVVIANLGSTYKRKDLSTIFYGGHVIIDHNGNREGYVKFSDLNLGPGEFYIIRLDK